MATTTDTAEITPLATADELAAAITLPGRSVAWHRSPDGTLRIAFELGNRAVSMVVTATEIDCTSWITYGTTYGEPGHTSPSWCNARTYKTRRGAYRFATDHLSGSR